MACRFALIALASGYAQLAIRSARYAVWPTATAPIPHALRPKQNPATAYGCCRVLFWGHSKFLLINDV